MDKRQQFLWIVQTTILTNAINLSSQPTMAKTYRHAMSATGVGFIIAEAVSWASGRIPDAMDVADAAHEFCVYMLCNLRDEHERADRRITHRTGTFSERGEDDAQGPWRRASAKTSNR
jgi:chloramphenicol 3-O-phosphotransferase